MVETFYIDTCIYLNAWRKEENEGILYWKMAEEFFERIEKQNYTVYYSEHILKELKSVLKEEDFNRKEIIFQNSERFKEILLDKKEKNFAREIEMELDYSLGFYDIIHMILAKKVGAILVTRDGNLLCIAKRYGVEAKKPEELV